MGTGARGVRARRRRRDTGTSSRRPQGLGVPVGDRDGDAGTTGDSEQGNGRRPGMDRSWELVGAGEGVMGPPDVGGDPQQAMAEDSDRGGRARDAWSAQGLGWLVGGEPWRVDFPGNPGLTSPGQGLPLKPRPQRGC